MHSSRTELCSTCSLTERQKALQVVKFQQGLLVLFLFQCNYSTVTFLQLFHCITFKISQQFFYTVLNNCFLHFAIILLSITKVPIFKISSQFNNQAASQAVITCFRNVLYSVWSLTMKAYLESIDDN